MKFDDYIKGQKCVVVAPSGYLRGRGAQSGAFIESFDRVIKMTSTCEILDEDNELGRRCDVLYGLALEPQVGWHLDPLAAKKQNVQYLRPQGCHELYREKWNRSVEWFNHNAEFSQIKISYRSEQYQNALVEKLGCFPLTGVFAILDLLEAGASEVYAYGHDFYRTGYFQEVAAVKAINNGWHKDTPHLHLLWELLNNESRFNCDENLKEILHSHFDTNYKRDDWLPRILASEFNYFNQAQHLGTCILLRTCNIEKFLVMAEQISKTVSKDELHIISQSSVFQKIKNQYENTIEYKHGDTFNSIYLNGLVEQESIENIDTICIPYNGTELHTYIEIFKLISIVKPINVYLISLRGVVRRLVNPLEYAVRIVNYMEKREQLLIDYELFDKVDCL